MRRSPGIAKRERLRRTSEQLEKTKRESGGREDRVGPPACSGERGTHAQTRVMTAAVLLAGFVSAVFLLRRTAGCILRSVSRIFRLGMGALVALAAVWRSIYSISWLDFLCCRILGAS